MFLKKSLNVISLSLVLFLMFIVSGCNSNDLKSSEQTTEDLFSSETSTESHKKEDNKDELTEEDEEDDDNDSSLNVDIDTFVKNYNDYLGKQNGEELKITEGNTEKNDDKDYEVTLTYTVSDEIKFVIKSYSPDEGKIDSIKFSVEDFKNSSKENLSLVLKAIICSSNVNVSQDELSKFADDFVSRVMANETGEVSKYFGKYLYDSVMLMWNDLEITIVKRSLNKSNYDESNCVNIDTDDFIKKYNDYSDAKINDSNISINDDVDTENIMTISFDEDVKLQLKFWPFKNNKVRSISFKADGLSSMEEQQQEKIYSIIKNIVLVVNSNDVSEDEAKKYSDDLVQRIKQYNENKDLEVDKFLGNYRYTTNYYWFTLFQLDIFKDEKEEREKSDYYFDYTINDIENRYNEYLKKVSYTGIDMSSKTNNDNNDYSNRLTYILKDNFEITLIYNPMMNDMVESMDMDIKDYESVSKEDVQNVLKSIFVAINRDLSEEEAIGYANDLFERLYKNSSVDIDKTFGNYKVKAYSNSEKKLSITISKNN